MSSWKVDPLTGDYALENGAPIQDDSISQPAYFRFKVKRNKWLYAPDNKYGSDFHLLKKRPTAAQSNSLVSVGERALQPLIDDGRASNISVEMNTEINQNRSNAILDVSVVDSNQKQQDLKLPAIMGG